MPKVRMPDGSLVDVGTDALFADDGVNPFVASPATLPGQTFTADDMARARQEEKDKLYSRIEGLTQEINGFKEQVGTLTAAEQQRQQQAEAERQRLEAEARAAEEQELDAKTLVERRAAEWEQQLQTVNQTWQEKWEQAEQARQAAEALAAKEREFGELRDYTLAAVEKVKDQIAPQFLPFIKGDSQAEIDASVTAAVNATNEILAELQQVPNTQQVVLQQPPVPVAPGTRVTAGPANTDPSGQFQQQYTPDQINNMSMAEYAKFRQQAGIGGQSNDRGLFG